MNTQVKVIKTKVGLMNLAEQLGNVSKACKIFIYSRDSYAGAGVLLSMI